MQSTAVETFKEKESGDNPEREELHSSMEEKMALNKQELEKQDCSPK